MIVFVKTLTIFILLFYVFMRKIFPPFIDSDVPYLIMTNTFKDF